MQGRKYETTGKARKMIGDAAWYMSLIVFLMVIFVVASVIALMPVGTVDHDAGYLASELDLTQSSDGQVTVSSYVDVDGHVMLCVDNLLNSFPYMVVVFGCLICLLLLFLPRQMKIFLTLAYVLFIFYETLMFREVGEARTNFVLFSYAGRFLTEPSTRAGVVK